MVSGLAALGLALSSSTTTHAQRRREPPPEAVKFYKRSRGHYERGRYRDAIADLQRAITLDPGSPTLVYNLARVHELLGELDEAIEHYERYVALLPEDAEAEERERIRETLRRLRGARDEVGQDASSAPAAPADRHRKQQRGARYVTSRGVADLPFWLTLGGGVGLLAAGGALGTVALLRHRDADSFVVGRDGTHGERNELQDKAEGLALGADILLVTGGLAVLGAGLLYLLRKQTEEVMPSQLRAGIGSDGHGAVLTVGGAL